MPGDRIDIAWVNSQVAEYSSVMSRYSAMAECLEGMLADPVSKLAPYAIIKTRVKTIAGFTEKAIRKKSEFPDPVRQFTDLCGARIIVHTKDQLEPVCNYIEKSFKIDWENSIDQSSLLKSDQFGYRSIHYIISIDPELLPTGTNLNGVSKAILPDSGVPMKAEVQVRTILEHAWSVFNHLHVYKGSFDMPELYRRELAGVAALLESADTTLARIRGNLLEYLASYSTYLSPEEIGDEIRLNEVVHEQDPSDLETAHRIGMLAITIGDWDRAISILSRYSDSQFQPIVRDLGFALCKKNKKDHESEEYLKGRRFLEQAIELDPEDIDAISSLAGRWKNIDDDKARDLYRRAFKIDLENSYVLGNYLEYELLGSKDTQVIPLLSKVLNDSTERCRKQVEVGMNIPWGYYDIGKFLLILEKEYDALFAYLRAVCASNAWFMIDTSLNSILRLKPVIGHLPGYFWAANLMRLFKFVKFQEEKDIGQLDVIDNRASVPTGVPVVILAGSTNEDADGKIQGFRDVLIEGFKGFRGIIISGGTFSGVNRLVGDIQELYGNEVRTMGYLPEDLPGEVEVDPRHAEFRSTPDDMFSPLQSLQYWADIVASGIDPASVKLIGIGGGIISGFEYGLASGLGAQVGILSDSGWSDRWGLNECSKAIQNPFRDLPGTGIDIRDFLAL